MRSLTAATTAQPSTRSTFAWTILTLAAALAVAGACASTPNAQGASLASKQAQAAQLDREVGKLEDEYADLQERYRGAQVELKGLRVSITKTTATLETTRADLGVAKQTLLERALAVYQDGAGSTALLDVARAGSFSEFFEKVDAIERVGNQDTQILGRVESLERKVATKQATLKSAGIKQVKVVKQANTSKTRMGKVLGQRKAKLGSVTAEIRSIMSAQRAAAARKEAAESRQRVRLIQAGKSVPTGGTPTVGTAPTNDAGDAAATPQPTPADGGAAPAAEPAVIDVPLPPVSGSAASAAGIAMGQVGKPYVYGAAGPSSFDCSGLVVWAFGQAGRGGLPHSTYSLIGMGVEVPMSQAQVGDLVFTNNAGHMGIYVGGGSFVHAPRTGRNVTVESLGNYTVISIRRI
ncbi:MAG: C40 family peptidase [Thermoleophilia bacterium]|nr:C40 family peptidase [Thermoleophilia bacterium]